MRFHKPNQTEWAAIACSVILAAIMITIGFNIGDTKSISIMTGLASLMLLAIAYSMHVKEKNPKTQENPR